MELTCESRGEQLQSASAQCGIRGDVSFAVAHFIGQVPFRGTTALTRSRVEREARKPGVGRHIVGVAAGTRVVRSGIRDTVLHDIDNLVQIGQNV